MLIVIAHFLKPTVLDKNLFASSDATLANQPLIYSGRAQPKGISEVYVQLGTFTYLGTTATQAYPGVQLSQTLPKKNSSKSSVVVSLGNTPYLLNDLKFRGYPDVERDGGNLQGIVTSKTFSYTVAVSRDQQQWIQLVNYSQFGCSTKQHLCFPTQAAR